MTNLAPLDGDAPPTAQATVAAPPAEISAFDTPATGNPAAGNRRGVPAWIFSGGFHFLIVLIAALFAGSMTAPAVQRTPLRAAGIVLAQPASSSGKVEYLSEASATASTATAQAAAALNTTSATTLNSALPASDAPPVDVEGFLPEAEDNKGLAGSMAGSIAAALPDAGDLAPSQLVGQVRGQGVNNDVQTNVFGIQSQGSKFVFVFDRSGSMAGFNGRPLAAAKRELINGLEPLGRMNQFQIIFYNERSNVFNPFNMQHNRMMWGSDREKKLATAFVRKMVAQGNTYHLRPLHLALNLSPDVIYFLTDAREPPLTSDQLALIRRLNRAATVINTIELGHGPLDSHNNFLIELARQNRGQHAYVDVSKLPAAH